MNKSRLALFDRAAVERRRFGFTVVRTFDRSPDAESVLDFAGRQRTPGSVAGGNFFVKHHRPKGWSDWRCGLQHDDECGLLGGNGEAVNTLAANLLGAPSHKLFAHARNMASGRTWCVFERLAEMQSLESFIQSAGNSVAAGPLFTQVAAALVEGLKCGLFHGDPNASNVFVDGRGRVKLIDYAITVNLSATVGRGLALQFSKMWDERLKPIFSYDEFREIVRAQLKLFGNPADLELDFSRFVHYSQTRNNWARRMERLKEASGGNPDFSLRLERVLLPANS